MLDLFTSLEDFGDTLNVRVTPKAASNRVKVEHHLDGSKYIRVYVTCVPEDGKANKAVIQLLSKELGIPKSYLTITQGATTREKTITIRKN